MRNCFLFLVGGLFVGGFVSIAAFGAVLEDKPAQRAIVDQFVGRYCHPRAGVDQTFLLGEAAALSRVSIASGLQPIAWAEYLKCKAGL